MRGYDSLPALRAALVAVDPRRLDGYLRELGAPSDVVAGCRFFEMMTRSEEGASTEPASSPK